MAKKKPGMRVAALLTVCIVVIGCVLGACESTTGGGSSASKGPSAQEQASDLGRYAKAYEVEVSEGAEAFEVEESPEMAQPSYALSPAPHSAVEQSIVSEGGALADVSSADPVALPAVAPGEELWIIATPGQTGDDAVEIDDPTEIEDTHPGAGALLATVISDDGDIAGEPVEVPLPLTHTAVHAQLVGYVGTVDVTQQFENPFDEKIEAVYLFPLPEKAAVSEFVMTIGERRIRGILRERAEAEAIYREARAQGYQASLLTQHRPNIFEQKVANIEPGNRIDVNIRYFHTLAYRDGWYSFVFPTVVGPRYNPPGFTDPVQALPRSHYEPVPQGAGVRYLRPEERSGHDISITVELDAGVAIEAMEASHRINESRTDSGTTSIELANQATIPNRDFVLDFKVTGERIKANLLTYMDREKGQGYFTMMLYPPSDLEDLRRHPVEMVFVVDSSGSMEGEPITQAKEAILEALDLLEPTDTFQVIRFSTDASQFGQNPVPATRDNIARAKRYVRGLHADGGTEMNEGIRAALGFAHDPGRLRFVTFLTDGYIGNEIEILGEIHNLLGESRIFSFGVGDSVNRYLLERMAVIGRGAVAFLGLDDSGGEVMKLFFDRVSHPALSHLEIDWGDMHVTDVYPSRLPDLFVGRPIVVTGKYLGEPGQPMVHGHAGGESLAFALPRDAREDAHAFIPIIWARLRIADLVDQQAWVHDPYNELARAIKETALEYGLMSDYTAFVAVDANGRTAGGRGTTVYQAVPVPEGVRYQTTVGE